MRTNRKTEEKKMSMNKNIARLAVTAGLTAALTFGGVMAPVTMAFAAEGGTAASYVPTATTTGNVIIAENTYVGTTFKGIQIFKATVTQGKADTNGDGVADEDGVWNEDGEKTLSDITWASDDVRDAVTGAFTAEDSKPEGDNAQTWAEWINTKTADEYAGVTDQTTKLNVGTTLDRIARALKDKQWTNPKNGTAGTFEGIAAGYWLFETQSVSKTTGTDGSDDAYTSPIFTVVGGENVNPEPKKSVPTVEKKILDDSKVAKDLKTVPEGDWKDVADSQIGQEVNYKLTGTIANNYASYDSYSYKFTDTLTKGLSYVNDQTKVYAVNKDSSNKDKYTDISNNFTVNSTKNTDGTTTLTVEANAGDHSKHLKDISDVNANTKIVVFYKAKLNANAVIAGANGGQSGNPNTVTLEYSNNPMAEGTGTSAPDKVKDYTYGLKINKVDLGTEKALKDAKFTITTNGDEKSAEVKYVTKDGALSDGVVELTTDPDGVIKLTGLDAGVYTVTETSAPDGYTKVKPFTFEIKPTMNANDPDAGLTALSGTLDDKNQSDKVIAGLTDKNAGDNKLTAQTGSEKAADGYFNITVGDTKQVGLPLTGLNGVTSTWIAGGAVLCIGVAHLIRSRKQAEESEQE